MSDEMDDFLEHGRTQMFPKLRDSALSVTIMPDEPDPKVALELGAAILYDKPIIVVVPRGRSVPANLRRVASKIIEAKGDGLDGVQDEVQAAIENIVEQDARAK